MCAGRVILSTGGVWVDLGLFKKVVKTGSPDLRAAHLKHRLHVIRYCASSSKYDHRY